MIRTRLCTSRRLLYISEDSHRQTGLGRSRPCCALTSLIRRGSAEVQHQADLQRGSTIVHASTEKPGPSPLRLEPVAAWLFFAGYLYYLLFSPYPPGEPAINPDTSALIEILHESLNLFYLNIWLDSLQLSPIPSIPEHPISESIFNIIMGWGMMLGPAILADARSEKVPQRYFQWALIVSIWTFALMPYMAQRASQEPLPASENAPTSSSQLAESDTPGWQKGVGTLGILVGAFSLGWWALGRPEYGDLAERVAFFSTRLANQRVFGGFLVDLGIYWLAQWLFMRGAGAPKSYSAVPYFGVGAWLVAGRPRE